MKTLLFGADGQVGWELRHSLAPIGQVRACDRRMVDLEQQDELRAAIRDYRPELIVNAAAYSAVDKAEADPDTAKRVNADAVGLLATEAKRLDAILVHYSTDYVFDGTKAGAYVETDTPNPLNVYGRTKLEGEKNILDSGCRHFIFRLSWIHAPRRANFVLTILRIAQEQETIRVVSDQTGTPTSARFVARMTALSLQEFAHAKRSTESLLGIYNVAPTGVTSRYQLVCYLLREAQGYGIRFRCPPKNVQAISTTEYPLPAKRPLNGRLYIQKFRSTLNVRLPTWQTEIHHTLQKFSERNMEP